MKVIMPGEHLDKNHVDRHDISYKSLKMSICISLQLFAYEAEQIVIVEDFQSLSEVLLSSVHLKVDEEIS